MALSVTNMGGGGGGGGTYPVGIEVTSPPTRLSYKPGEALDLTGIVVKAIYSDGSRQVVTPQCTFNPANGAILTKNSMAVAISWTWPTLGNSYSASQTIAMQVPYRIRVKTAPTKTAYKAGESLTVAGMVVVADYSDGTEVNITSQATVSPAAGTTLYEDRTGITLSWTDPETSESYQTTQTITVARVLSSLSVSAPTKNSYKIDETLNLSGAAVTAHFSSGKTENVTSKATFNPANGTKLTSQGTVTITASYTEGGVTKTATTSVTVKPSLEIVTWANGTDDQIAAMLEAHYAGTINIYDYWKVGDERNVQLSAMAAGAVGETHVAQTVTYRLDHAGGKDLETAINGKSKCAFVVGQKNFLANGTNGEWGYMNSSNTNAGGWDSSKRRTWCNDTYRNALPAKFRALFKRHKNVTANGSGSTAVTSIDYFALPSEKEVFGATSYANSTAESANFQFDIYKTSANRVKKQGNAGSAYYWWGRSPYSGGSNYFCIVSNSGSADWYSANDINGIAPFGCI